MTDVRRPTRGPHLGPRPVPHVVRRVPQGRLRRLRAAPTGHRFPRLLRLAWSSTPSPERSAAPTAPCCCAQPGTHLSAADRRGLRPPPWRTPPAARHRSATSTPEPLLLALLSLFDHTEADPAATRRIGIFSYGSGCSSEFCSWLLNSRDRTGTSAGLADALAARSRLDVAAYDEIAATPATRCAPECGGLRGRPVARAEAGARREPRPPADDARTHRRP
ncbi:hypothetical protein ACRAWF_30560 [Streptomyces sp. L7]